MVSLWEPLNQHNAALHFYYLCCFLLLSKLFGEVLLHPGRGCLTNKTIMFIVPLSGSSGGFVVPQAVNCSLWD